MAGSCRRGNATDQSAGGSHRQVKKGLLRDRRLNARGHTRPNTGKHGRSHPSSGHKVTQPQEKCGRACVHVRHCLSAFVCVIFTPLSPIPQLTDRLRVNGHSHGGFQLNGYCKGLIFRLLAVTIRYQPKGSGHSGILQTHPNKRQIHPP